MWRAAPALNSSSDSPHPAVSRFLDAMERTVSPNTLAAYRTDLTALARWLAERNVPILHTTRTVLQDFIAGRVRAGARPATTARRICSCRRFFRYFVREGAIREDPAALIALPKLIRSPPRSLTEEEVEALLSAPVVSDPVGMRDRTMLAVLYATGVRVSELVNLRTAQVNLNQGVINIPGKGNRERLIPLGEEATRGLKEFVGSVRDQILADRHSDYLFPTYRCDRMKRQSFCYIMKRYARKAHIGKPLSPKTLRHAYAMHLLNSGAELRVVQKRLGHNEWSTRIYGRVVRQGLK
jgi:integrase/recombinase XerD